MILTAQEVSTLQAQAGKTDPATREKILQLIEVDKIDRCKQSFVAFATAMWPVFISGKHHQIMAEAFERVAAGTLKRLIINMPPRHTKSEFASFLLPDRKSTRLNSSHVSESRMPSSA